MRGRTFTTYMNIEPGKGNERALSQFERQAQTSLNRVANIARAASTASTGMGMGTTAQSVTALANAERVRANAIQRSNDAAIRGAAANQRYSGSLLMESHAARAASKETTGFERSLRLASIAAQVAQGPLGPIAGRLSAIAVAVRELSGIRLGVVGAGAAIATFVRYASTAQDLRAKLQPLYETQTQVNAAFKDAQYIANSARVGLEPVIDLYARLTLGGREAGMSASRISRLTEIAAKAAKLSGGTGVSQEAGLYQFAQGIGSGTLQGDELRSVRENTLRLAKAIADGMGVSIAELKKLGKEGALTPKAVADALEREAGRIDAEMAKLPPTISSASTKMSNAFIDLITKADQSTGVVGGFARLLTYAADNLTTLAKALGMAALAYAGFRSAQMIQGTQARITAWQAERREIIRTTTEAKNKAVAERRQSAERVVALRQERAALQQQVVAERALYQQRLQTARAALTYVQNVNLKGAGPDARGMQMYRDAMNQARVAGDNLHATQARLSRVSLALSGQFGLLTNHTRAFRVASVAAASASRAWTASLRGLMAAINPLGIALAIAIPLLIEFAFREDMAATAGDRMAEAQMRLGRVIDSTTGKILTQNQALIQNAILEAKDEARNALRAYRDAKDNLGYGGPTDIFTNVSSIDPRVRNVRDQVRDRRLNANEAASALASLTGLNPASVEARDNLIRQLGNIAKLAPEVSQANAQVRLLTGQNDPETLRRAFGNFTGEDVELTARATAADEDATKARTRRAKATDEAAEAERHLNEIQTRSDKIADTLSRYDDQPRAIDRAERDKRELDQLVNKAIELRDAFGNAVGEGIYTQEQANADKDRIDYGVGKPIRDAMDEQERGIELSRMRLEGYDYEVDALEQALALQEANRNVSRDELETLIDNARVQTEINEALASRERQVGQILSVAEDTRGAFEDMLVGLRTDPFGSVKRFGNQLVDNLVRINARQLSERLFAGADDKLKELVRGSNGVDRAAEILAGNVRQASESTITLTSANDNLATATENAATRINEAAERIATGGGPTGLAPSSTLDRVSEEATKAARTVGQTADIVKRVTGGASGGLPMAITIASGAAAAAVGKTLVNEGGLKSGGEFDDNTIVVTSRSRRSGQGSLPSGQQAYNAVFQRLGEKLDTTFKSGTFFSGIGKGVGKALGGAGTGMMASSVLGMLGVKQSNTGAAIGGAIGSFLPIPGGDIIGGLIGGTIGGMFKKTKSGSATIGLNAAGEAFGGAGVGSNSAYRTAAGGLAGSVAERLNQVAQSLGATLSGGGSLSIGQRKDKFTVDTSGRNRTKGSGVLKFATEEEAAQYAFQQMLQKVVLGGISQASANIIRAGSANIDVAIQKALAIESIPKRLLEKTDPVRFAVEQLNEEFTKLIGYLREGGATTAQFADAQKLYELERAEAIEQASQRASAAIQAYLDEMMGGASSPLNKRTVYQNAMDKLGGFRADVASGKVVDQEAILTAAKNAQDASRALNGSGAAFFSDFNDIFALLSKARDNISSGTSTELPASPFSTAEMQNLLGAQVAATNDQTATLGAKLDNIANLLQPSGSSAIRALPAFSTKRDGMYEAAA